MNFVIFTITIIYIILRFINIKRGGFPTPDTILCIMWAGVLFMLSPFIQQYRESFFEIRHIEWQRDFISWFLLSILVGGILADRLIANKTPKEKDAGRIENVNKEIDLIIEKFSWIIYLNCILGLLRIFIIIRMSGIDSFMDYRLFVVQTLFTRMNWLESLIWRVSAHLYMLSMFLITLIIMRSMQKMTFSANKVLWYLIMFTPPSLASGGRLFIINFAVCFISAFAMSSQHLKNIKPKPKVAYSIILLLVILPVMFGMLGVLRSSDSEISAENVSSRLFYITDGCIILGEVKECGISGLDELKKTVFFGTNKGVFTPFEDIEAANNGCVYGMLTMLYYDFGEFGSCLFGFLFAFLLETFGVLYSRRYTVFSPLILLWIFKMCVESTIFNAIYVNYPMLIWISMLMVLHWMVCGRTDNAAINVN